MCSLLFRRIQCLLTNSFRSTRWPTARPERNKLGDGTERTLCPATHTYCSYSLPQSPTPMWTTTDEQQISTMRLESKPGRLVAPLIPYVYPVPIQEYMYSSMSESVTHTVRPISSTSFKALLYYITTRMDVGWSLTIVLGVAVYLRHQHLREYNLPPSKPPHPAIGSTFLNHYQQTQGERSKATRLRLGLGPV